MGRTDAKGNRADSSPEPVLSTLPILRRIGGAVTIEGSYDLADMRAKWEDYRDRMSQADGEGSIVGASFIIAKTACTDMLELLDLLDGALESSD